MGVKGISTERYEVKKRIKQSDSGSESYCSDEETKLLSKKKKTEVTPSDKIPYPKAVGFIVGNEFCERFTFYGMRTVLTIYLVNELMYSPDNATVIYHLFSLLAYFTPLFGAIIADSWLGKFKTILFISIIYCIGSIVLSIGAIPTGLTTMKTISLIGLLIIAIGTGGIKPCVSAFGGDQFKPGQEKELQKFFSFFYISINLGSVISTAVTPILREDVHCFGQDSCYPLAFGVPAILMIVALLLFVCGKPLYVINPPEGNIVVKVSRCMWNAIREKMTSKGEKKKEHWLDYAENKFDKKLIDEIKIVLKVLVLYVPLPVFWALFDQQGSRWTLQATKMNGVIGNFHIKPDQMMVFNPLLIVLFIPLFDYAIYPALKKVKLLTKPLQRMVTGGLLTAVSFGIAGFIELKLEANLPTVPDSGQSELTVINNSPCNVAITGSDSFSISSFQSHVLYDIPLEKAHSWTISSSSCAYTAGQGSATFTSSSPMQSMMITLSGGSLTYAQANETKHKPKGGEARVRVFYSTDQSSGNVSFLFKGEKQQSTLYPASLTSLYGTTEYTLLRPDSYKVFTSTSSGYSQTAIGSYDFLSGGTYIVYIYSNSEQGESKFNVERLVEPNNVHLLLQVPQYLIITAGEIMFSITGLEFSYSQSPKSMKSVLQAGWLLTVAFGNLLVLIIAKLDMFSKQSHELFFFGSLMAVTMVAFAVMAYYYKYVNIENGDEDNETESAKKTDSDKSTASENKTDSAKSGKSNEAYEEETDFNK